MRNIPTKEGKANLLGAFGSVGGFLAGALGLSIGNGTSSSPPAPVNNANAEPLVATRPRREEEYDPQTGQMLVTDENGNMKLFYKDEDGNLRVKEKDQDGNILDRMPNPKEFMNEVRSYQGYSQGATIINVSDTKIEREVFELRVNSKDIFINVTQTDSINAKDAKKKLDDIETIKSASIALLKKQLSEVDPKDPNQKKIKAAINSEISKLNKEAASAIKEVQRIARETQLNQDQPHLREIKATSNESRNLLMSRFKNENFMTDDGLKLFRKKLELTSSNDLYEFSKDGKLLHEELKNYTPTKEKIVRDGIKEISTNKILNKEGVKLIQDKVTNLLSGKISLNLANVKVSEGIESILNSQNQLRSQLTDPKLKAVNDSIKSFFELLNDSKNTLLGNDNTVKPSAIPISDQLKKAQVELENFKSGKTRELSADTIKIVTNQLTNDPDFAKISQPKALKDSFINQNELKDKLNIKINEMMTKAKISENGLSDNDLKEYRKELENLSDSLVKAQKEHKAKWDSYSKDVSELVRTRNADGELNLTSLRKVSESLVKIDTKTVKTKEVYTIMRDKDGNVALIGDENSTQVQRYREKETFQSYLEDLNKMKGIYLDKNTGEILGANGKPITDATKKQEKLAEIKAKLGDDFNPSSNPHFAKMEALANFTPPDKYNPYYRTSVNGVAFEFVGTHNVDPSKSILAANGADWMNLSNAAKESKVESIGITSLLRDDHSSHEMGYSMDVGSITPNGGETIMIKWDNYDFKTLEPESLAIPTKEVASFLESVRLQTSIQYNLNPYYMVYTNGEVIPNFFTFAPKELWDTDFSKLSKENKELVVNRIIEAARNHEPDSYSLDPKMAERMWDHRHHLHISETGFGHK